MSRYPDTPIRTELQAATVTLCDLAPLPIWAAWGGKIKSPVNPKSAARANASVSNPATWASRNRAERKAATFANTDLRGVGLRLSTTAMPEGMTLAGLDLDGCREAATGTVAPWAQTIIDRLGSYAEASPSGTGLHVLFLAALSDVDKLRKAGLIRDWGAAHVKAKHVEIAAFFGNKFLTVTDQQHGDNPTIAQVDLATLEWLLGEYTPAWAANGAKADSPDHDESGSGHAWRYATDLFRQGQDAGEVESALSDDVLGEAGEWWSRADDRQRARLLKRTADAVASERVSADSFDDDPESIAAENDAFLGIEPAAKPLGKYPLDENGIILAFTDKHKGELRFDHDAGKWFLFDGNYWRCEGTKLAHHYARQEATRMAKRDPKAKALNKVSTWEAVERGARPVRDFACTSEIWNRDPLLLGTPGGTVDLRTGKVRPGKPDDHISKITAAAPIPLHRFRPERDCPLWLAFLGQALDHDAAAIRFLQQWGGYSLTGDTREQVLLFVYGPGGSGKGTAINTIGDVLGGYSINVGMETLTASKHDRHTTEIARLHGARMARASEAEKGKAWAENRIKTLTGQDTITARFMRQDDFEFTPQFKLTIFANNRPSMTDVDTAMKRRFMILPFDHPPKVKDPDLGAKLKAEWPGILSWLIQGCLDWQANGLTRPPVLDRATESYFHEQDTFGQWLESCCDLGVGYAATTADLWESWSRFAYSLNEEPGSKMRTFPETMEQRGFKAALKVGPSHGRGFKGIQLSIESGMDHADRFDDD